MEGNWLRRESEGVLLAGASGKERPVPATRTDPSEPSPTEQTTSTRCWELGTSAGYVRELLRIEEALWMRSTEVSAAEWVRVYGRGRGRGRERSVVAVKVSRWHQELRRVARSLLRVSVRLCCPAQVPACPCSCLPLCQPTYLSGSLKVVTLLPALPCTTSPINFFLCFPLCGSLSLFFNSSLCPVLCCF